ncbi:MAG: peptide ABC transporter substrate-binding protein, partial [Anaerolineae bacterium]|nr:peptide ABC transporter substrate-binding protein [Anaerolineae bacterium]
GAPLTSEDIIFTIDLLRNPDLPVPADLREFWISIEVQAFDERTLQFRLTEPFAPFLDYLTFGVLPKHILGELSAPELINAEFNLSPVGSGPYEFEQLLIEDENVSGIVLKAFEGYFQKRALIDQVIFRYYDSSTAALDAYRQDQVNGIGQVTPDILMDVLAEPALNIYSGRLPQLTMVVMNLNSPDLPFFQDVEVRRALLTGLNRQKMVRRILSGQAVLADSPLFPGTWAYYDGLERVEYSPNAALDQLRAAGYRIPAEGGNIRAKDSVLLAFDLVHPNTETHTAIARSIQQDWARLNVKVNLVAVEYTSLVSDYLEPRNFQAALIDINLAGYSDPDPYPFWHQAQATGGQNYAGWNDRRASEYLEQARVTIDHDQRIRLYRNFQVHFSREMPAILLYYPIYNYAISDQVGGVRMGPLFDPSDRFFNLVTWFLHARGQIEDIISPSELP